MLSGLRVIRFGNTGLREKSELAFCMPTETAIRVIYSDREVECSALELASSLQILDMDTLLKAHVLAAVESDFEKLRAKLPAHGHVSRSPRRCANAPLQQAQVQFSTCRCFLSWKLFGPGRKRFRQRSIRSGARAQSCRRQGSSIHASPTQSTSSRTSARRTT